MPNWEQFRSAQVPERERERERETDSFYYIRVMVLIAPLFEIVAILN